MLVASMYLMAAVFFWAKDVAVALMAMIASAAGIQVFMCGILGKCSGAGGLKG